MQIISDLGKLSIDPRGFFTKLWDNFWGIFFETKNVLTIKTDHIKQVALIAEKFDELFGDKGPDENFKEAVLDKQSPEVTKKLNNGDRLSPDEVKKLQEDTLFAMRKQRYLDDLRTTLPAKFNLDLISYDQMRENEPKNAVFEKYLYKLKEELIKGGYPSLVTSHVDVHKFLFFVDGMEAEVTVNSLTDLPNLKKFLDRSRAEAKSEQVRLGTYQTKAELLRKLEKKDQFHEEDAGRIREQYLQNLEKDKIIEGLKQKLRQTRVEKSEEESFGDMSHGDEDEKNGEEI